MSDVLCTAPWSEVWMQWDRVATCCHLAFTPYYKSTTKNWAAWDDFDGVALNNPALLALRKAMREHTADIACSKVSCAIRKDKTIDTSSNAFTPKIIGIATTARCQAQCHYCEFWKKEGQPDPIEPAYEQIVRLTERLCVHKFGDVFYGGGDFFALNDQKMEQYLTVASCGSRVHILTNGIGLTKARWERWYRDNPNVHIRVTIDTMDPEIYARTRGPAGSRTIHANLRNLLSQPHKAHIGLACTVSRVTLGGIPNVLRFAREIGIDNVIVNAICATTPMLPKMNLLGEDADIATCEMLPKRLAEWSALAKQLGITLNGTDRFRRAVATKLKQLQAEKH